VTDGVGRPRAEPACQQDVRQEIRTREHPLVGDANTSLAQPGGNWSNAGATECRGHESAAHLQLQPFASHQSAVPDIMSALQRPNIPPSGALSSVYRLWLPRGCFPLVSKSRQLT